jgi:hypothetical protein
VKRVTEILLGAMETFLESAQLSRLSFRADVRVGTHRKLMCIKVICKGGGFRGRKRKVGSEEVEDRERTDP